MPSDASVAPSPLGFEPLRRIANNIYLFEPKVTDTPVYGPSLIVLTTWVGGVTPRKVQKYIAGHRGLWPGAAILLIITRATDVGLLPTRVLLSNIAPARDAIRRHVDARLSEKNGPSIMLHIFSNGGLFMAVSLIQSLRAREQGRIPLDLSPHIHGVVFDCTPGRTEFWRLYKAAIVGFTKSPLVVRTLGQAFAAMVSAILVSGQHLGVIDEGVDVLRDKVNNPRFLGSSPRLYLYARSDPVVGWKDVESHIEDARSRAGLSVESERYEDANHCALVAVDSRRYWDAIQGLWQRAEAESLVRGLPRSRL